MNEYEAEEKLAVEGLRIAESYESGWLWTWKDENGERIIWLVTDEA